MAKIKALVLTYKDHDLDTLAKAYLMDNELRELYKNYEALIALETCNRVEFYLDGDEDERPILRIIKERAGVEPRVLHDLEAVRHLLLVTAGLDSMFFGEREILSQVKRAYAAGKSSRRLRILFESAIRFGEQFRRRHDLSEISFVRFLSHFIMSNADPGRKILVIGGGEVARGVVRELLRKGYSNITMANRSLDKLRLEFGSRVRIMNLNSLMDDLLINRYDVWVVAISTRQPIIRVGNNVRNIPDLVIDVSVPAAVYVDGVPVKVLRLGDLREPYLKYVNGKVNTTDYLREVEAEAERIMRLIARSDADEVVRGIMRFVEEILNNEIREAINALNNGADPREVVEAMGRSLVKKLMHNYLENVRALAETGDISGAERLRDLFTRIIKSPGT